MKQKGLWALWAGLFILCAGLGFIPEPEGTFGLFLTALSVVFFLPPAALLIHAGKRKDTDTAKLIRNFSILSLALTVAVLILNFFTALSSEFVGQLLHYVLVIVSCPMICSGHWALSLFLWACLFMVSLQQCKR